MDPLAILKDFCLTGQLEYVIIDGERVKFADKYSFPKQTPTAFRAKDGTGDFYSLEAVSFFIKTISADANMGPYVQKAVSTKTEQIEVKDRQPLRDYLTGKVDHTVHVSDVVPTVNFYEPAAKKPRTDGGEEAAALQHLFEQEKQLRNRNSLLGKAWQFKGFPYKGADKGEMMETFSQLLGVYFHYSDEQVPDNVKSWKVMKLPLRRNARHLDNTVMLEFYKQLDVFLASKRCELDF
eukprot:gene4479-4733_t